MTADTTYRVGIEFDAKGLEQFESRMDSVMSSISGMGSQVGNFASAVANSFTGIVESAGAVALSFGKMGAALGVAGVTYGVASLNKELEATQLSLAAIFTARDQSSGITAGLDDAGKMMKEMRRDAAELPGEFSDLVGIFKTISVPGFNAGMDKTKLKDMAKNTMAVSAVMGVPMDMAGREMGMLLGGRAGSHNVLGTRLGFTAENFNKLDEGHRVAAITAELKKWEPVIELYKHSFEGISSTLVDNAKQFLGAATLPLFEKVKTTMSSINDWFDANQGKVGDWALYLSNELVGAWSKATEMALEWGPIISRFATDAYAELKQLWGSLEPIVDRLGTALKSAIQDGSLIEGIKEILKLYAEVKIGGAALSMGGGIMSGAAAFGKMAPGALGMFAGKGVDGASKQLSLFGEDVIGKASGGVAAEEAAVGLGLTTAGAVAAGGALAAAAVAIAAVTGEMSALADTTSVNHANAVAAFDSLHIAMTNLTDTVSVTLKPALESFGVWMTKQAGVVVQGAADLTVNRRETWRDVLNSLSTPDNPAETDYNSARDGHLGDRILGKTLWRDDHESPDRTNQDLGMAAGGGILKMTDSVIDAVKVVTKKPPQHGHVSVAKVEITIAGNDEPSRVARMVHSELAAISRNPKVSRYIPNLAGS